MVAMNTSSYDVLLKQGTKVCKFVTSSIHNNQEDEYRINFSF